MPSSRQRVGAAGEQLAVAWYEARGYEVLARNWRCRAGEIDLVVANRLEVVFCEVKTRSSSRFGSPAEAVTIQKQRRLRRLAAAWFQSPGPGGAGSVGRSVRFDVASVVGGRVDVIEGAF